MSIYPAESEVHPVEPEEVCIGSVGEVLPVEDCIGGWDCVVVTGRWVWWQGE